MNRIYKFVLMILVLLTCVGCSSNKEISDNVNEDIPFSDEYKNFTPLIWAGTISFKDFKEKYLDYTNIDYFGGTIIIEDNSVKEDEIKLEFYSSLEESSGTISYSDEDTAAPITIKSNEIVYIKENEGNYNFEINTYNKGGYSFEMGEIKFGNHYALVFDSYDNIVNKYGQ